MEGKKRVVPGEIVKAWEKKKITMDVYDDNCDDLIADIQPFTI